MTAVASQRCDEAKAAAGEALNTVEQAVKIEDFVTAVSDTAQSLGDILKSVADAGRDAVNG